jgi:hypothetical protein
MQQQMIAGKPTGDPFRKLCTDDGQHVFLRGTNPSSSISTIARSFSAALDDAFFSTTPELDNLSQSVAQKYGTSPI